MEGIMLIELAPMEGITTYIYRNALHKYYGGVDRYYTPFISTHKDKELNFKEKNEIRPENNVGIELIPQILTADSDEFIYTAGRIQQYGYNYVNLNFGCPSGTVTPKGKGAGILRDLDKLETLLDNIFMKTDMKVSVKTRIGYEAEGEWEKIIKIYEKFPIEELIIHARVREDFYKGNARIDAVKEAFDARGLDNTKALGKDGHSIKISYNGDIYSVGDYNRVVDIMPYADALMIGRGIIGNPALAKNIKINTEKKLNSYDKAGNQEALLERIYLDHIEVSENKAIADIETFKAFNLELIDKYNEIMPGEKNTLFKLKELWVYMHTMFPEDSKVLKKVQKSKSLKDYELIIKTMEQFTE